MKDEGRRTGDEGRRMRDEGRETKDGRRRGESFAGGGGARGGFVFCAVCGIINTVRLTLTLGVQLDLVLLKERQKDGAPSKMANSWDGIAGRHQLHWGT